MRMHDVNRVLYTKAIQTFGYDSQIIIAIEECSELIKELTKTTRGKGNFDNLSEEIADVEIMLEQVKLMFQNQERVNFFIRKKNARIENLIKDKQGVKNV